VGYAEVFEMKFTLILLVVLPLIGAASAGQVTRQWGRTR
jgi:hypothetical protein